MLASEPRAVNSTKQKTLFIKILENLKLTPHYMKILSTLAVRGVLLATAQDYEKKSGTTLEFDFAATLQLKEKIKTGTRGDLAILTAEALDEFCTNKLLEPDSASDLVSSDIALATTKESSVPDVSNTETLIKTLLAARAVAYSKQGASGVYFAGLLKRMKIDEEVNRTAVVIQEGLTGHKLISGEADLAVQQLSELMQVPGINIFAKLPAEVQSSTVFSAARFTETKEIEASNAYIDYLCSHEVLTLFKQQGLTPIGKRRKH
jgi:molybdate transport system substrate-binding protein